MKPNTFHLVSLGCAKNTVDSTTMGNLLAKQGYTFEDDPAKAEVIIVNTCGFIRPARFYIDASAATHIPAAPMKRTVTVLQ